MVMKFIMVHDSMEAINLYELSFRKLFCIFPQVVGLRKLIECDLFFHIFLMIVVAVIYSVDFSHPFYGQ